LLIYFIGLLIEPILIQFNIETSAMIVYLWFILCIHFVWVMNIQDLTRLNYFHKLGRFATRWLETSIREEELNTYTSAAIMLLSWMPFLLSPFQILISICLIGAISDAMASIIGKKYGTRFFKNSPKSLIGNFFGGFTTFLVINFIHFVIPFDTNSIITVEIIAIATSLGFMIVDRFAKDISDNFLNPFVCGSIMWVLLKILL